MTTITIKSLSKFAEICKKQPTSGANRVHSRPLYIAASPAQAQRARTNFLTGKRQWCACTLEERYTLLRAGSSNSYRNYRNVNVGG
jgi:hypothetical protein